jgi:hypothetical protein
VHIHDLHADDGSLRAFEVENILLSRRRACKIVESITGATIVRRTRIFGDSDDFCEFTLDGFNFIIEEPFGDNSRYWVGSKEAAGSTVLPKVREAFQNHKTLEAPLRLLVVLLFLFVAWFAYPRVLAFVAQDRCLDAGGSWNAVLQTCHQGNHL